MATRADIRDAVYSELTQAADDYDVTTADGTVLRTITLDADDIGLRNPESTESLPQVVYHENYRQVTYNGVGRAPDQQTFNDDGSVADERWNEYVEALFIIDVRADREAAKEPIYERLRTIFGKYQHGAWVASDLHPDVIDIEVRDTSSLDQGDVEDVIRGDQFEVAITFYRQYVVDEANIEEVDLDADGVTYTTQ